MVEGGWYLGYENAALHRYHDGAQWTSMSTGCRWLKRHLQSRMRRGCGRSRFRSQVCSVGSRLAMPGERVVPPFTGVSRRPKL
jgi:hypothetical protein